MAVLMFFLLNQLQMIDSSIVYMLWGQLHECIAYNTVIDGVQIVNRALSPSGYLNVHQTDGAVSFWVDDIGVYNQEFGPARYPHSIASDIGTGDGPHICFPYLFGGSWGGAGAVYESGGWWSSYWDTPYDLGPGNIGAIRVLGKQLSDDNLMFVIQTADALILWGMGGYTWAVLDSGYCAGFDINDSIGYIFYWHDSLLCFRRFAGNWSPRDTYDIIWPLPYNQNLIMWTQVAVTDAGNPLLVFDDWNGDDNTYPYYSKVYVSYAEGESCVKVSSTFGAPDTECFYPTIATEGNLTAVIYSMPRNNLNDSLCWNDIFINWSTDQGVTWGIPKNLTGQNDSLRLGLQQIAKRIDVPRQRAFIVCAGSNYDPYWSVLYGTGGTCCVCFTYGDYMGIEENTMRTPLVGPRLEVYPNPTDGLLYVEGAILGKAKVTIYDVMGRPVSNFPCLNKQFLDLRGLNQGLYFLRIEQEKDVFVRKFVLLK